jgi:hypothetical protein
MNTGSMALLQHRDSIELPNQEQVLRNEIFDYLESERKKMVEVLQEDVAQLVSIAKIKLSANNADNVEDCLAMALSRLSALSFEIKPQMLTEFGLAPALRHLMYIRLGNNCEIQLHKLPAAINISIETALFRLVQLILNNLPITCLGKFEVEVLKLGGHVCLKNNIYLQPKAEPDLQPNYIAGTVLKALKHIVYMFSGHAVFQLLAADNIELLVCLKETVLL